MDTVTIRPYISGDFESLQRIHDPARLNELALASLSEAFLPFSVASEREVFFSYPHIDVAILNGQAVGFSAYTDEELAWLYVSPDHSRQKIGTALVERALQTEPGIHEIEVLVGNEPARNLYEKFHFRTARIVTGVMPGNEAFPVSVYSMERPLSSE